MTTIALVGTGFVADYYMTTLANYPELRLAGVWDRDAGRLGQFCRFHDARAYGSLEECLDDPEVSIVVNLTSPESHFALNCKALNAGKHVYCEKPLGMSYDEASEVVALAERKGLTICGAPANGLSDAQALTAELIAGGRIGAPRLAYAEMEDGPVFKDNWPTWRSRSGAKWPGVHEFEIGCTLEHAGYGLSWLVALFGAVESGQAFSALTFPDKGPGTGGLAMAPDFSVGCLSFRSGVTARLTCGLAAPRDRSLTIVGDEGTLVVRDLWDDRSPVHLSRFEGRRPLLQRLAGRIERRRGRVLPLRLTHGRAVAYLAPPKAGKLASFPSQIDFARGIAVMADAIAAGEAPFFSGTRALHLTELALALNAGVGRFTPRSVF
ncbi:Gfo/Idh/MocA family oxidoreductase [Hoeflea sp. YIM 152468]|uniref:Gfo/Idh/MocA family protein n=1 Tax=Hoeflea sp. YIM 152468 TaxID=3031759 RepID=UPI0023DBE26A|nr:Gfo/Idh/MocA family oxidoreductase [Hoeflea sp. YIM 152468]MDF1609769.1 Gfo/Idh/MocA family oxidoreductase [Hoeflea sp. YIM 152468]